MKSVAHEGVRENSVYSFNSIVVKIEPDEHSECSTSRKISSASPSVIANSSHSTLPHIPVVGGNSCGTGQSSGNNLNIFQSTSGSPEQCLMLNQTYQRAIVETMSKLQLILDNNKEEQHRLREDMKEPEKPKKHIKLGKGRGAGRPITLFAAPYFRDVRGSNPPENEDAKIKRKNGDVDAYLIPPKPWTSKEHRSLIKAVSSSAQQTAIEPLVTTKKFFCEKLKRHKLPKKDENNLKSKIRTIEEEIEELNEKDVNTIVEEQKKKLDWMKISAIFMDGVRSPEECEYMWFNYLHPSINKRKFTSEEDKKLAKIAEKHNCRDWDAIAKELDTNRTSIQCLERFQSKLNPAILNKYWTKEEDQDLINVVDSCRVGKSIPWHQVAYYMPGRSRLQITNRWSRTLFPENNTGPWTKEEDAILVAGVKKYGHEWKKTKELLVGRSNYSCRERYTNFLVPGLKTGSWTAEEDTLLIKMIRKYGERKWSKVCQHLEGRTDNMCLQRANCLKRHDEKLFKKLIKKKIGGTDDEDDDDDLLPSFQLAPSNNCVTVNAKREKLRSDAKNRIASAIMKIAGHDATDEKRIEDTFDLATASSKTLQELSKQLLSNREVQHVEHSEGKHQVQHVERSVKRRQVQIHYDDNSSSESASLCSEIEEEDLIDSEDEKVSHGKRRKNDVEKSVDKELLNLFLTRAAIGPPKHKKCVAMSQKKVIEQEEVKNYLYQGLNVKESEADNEETSCSSVYRKVNFSISIPRMMQCFVLPAFEENQIAVMPANITCLTAFKIFVMTQRMLKYHNRELLRKFTNYETLTFSKYASVCCGANCQELISSDGEDPNNGSSNSSSEKCSCKIINNASHQLQLMRKRFLSVFLWSHILSNASFSKEQINFFFSKESKEELKRDYVKNVPVKLEQNKKTVLGKRSRQDAEIKKKGTEEKNETIKEENVKIPKVKRVKKEKIEVPPENLRRSARIAAKSK